MRGKGRIHEVTQEGRGGCRTDPGVLCVGEFTRGGDDGVSSCGPKLWSQKREIPSVVGRGWDRKEDLTPEDTSHSADLKVRQYVSKLLGDDKIEVLTWVDNASDNDRIS
jgi:hypothetical protein